MLKVAQEAVVAVTNTADYCRRIRFFVVCITIGLLAPVSNAVVLPEDSIDVLYHRYDGGGMTIDGPSVLVRKSATPNVSVTANYYVDMVSSASVDVIATASPYEEERTEYGVGVELLNNKTVMSLGYSQSDENDFNAKSLHFNVTQDFFGDLTTLGMGVSKGWDQVGKVGAPDFSEDVDRTHFRLSLAQILTKNLLLNANYELITDQGYLNNPYRQVRYLLEDGISYDYQAEVYPETRTSNAFALKGTYFLPYRAAAKMEYRYFTDTWGIDAHTLETSYVHPVESSWEFDVKYRYYQQSSASFYADLFPYQDAKNFLARDKEMSSFSSNTIGVGVTYRFATAAAGGWVKEGTLSLLYDHMIFVYDDFRDVTKAGYVPGTEPLYDFNADVTRLFVTIWY